MFSLECGRQCIACRLYVAKTIWNAWLVAKGCRMAASPGWRSSGTPRGSTSPVGMGEELLSPPALPLPPLSASASGVPSALLLSRPVVAPEKRSDEHERVDSSWPGRGQCLPNQEPDGDAEGRVARPGRGGGKAHIEIAVQKWQPPFLFSYTE